MTQITLNRQSARSKKRATTHLWGLALLFAFVVQAILAEAFGLRWESLAKMQQQPLFAQWSGISLAIYLGGQWMLPLMRIFGRKKAAKRHYHRHKQIGIFAPLIFYIHSMQIGYAFVTVLSAVYLANTLLGLLSVDVVYPYLPISRKRYTFWWMILHVALSLLTVGMMGYHAYIAFAFK